MNRKFKIKIAVDMLMTISLLFLMSFELIGDAAHERLGMEMYQSLKHNSEPTRQGMIS